MKRIREKTKTAYHTTDLVHIPKMKDQTSWKRMQRASVMESKVRNKTSEVEMISAEMMVQDSGRDAWEIRPEQQGETLHHFLEKRWEGKRCLPEEKAHWIFSVVIGTHKNW